MTRVMAQFSRNRRPLGIAFVLGLVVASAVAVVRVNAAAELKGPQANDRAVARAVTKTLVGRASHASSARHRNFAAVLQGIHEDARFLQTLFLAERLRQFQALRRRIGHARFATATSASPTRCFETLLTRIDERMKLVDSILADSDKLDFTTDEEMITDPDQTAYAATPEQMQDKWTKRIKYDISAAGNRRKDAEGRNPRQAHAAAITASPSGCTRSTATNCWKCI